MNRHYEKPPAAWEMAKNALEKRPDAPEGYHNGRPYFFWNIPIKDLPDAAYHVWFDSPLEDLVHQKEPNDTSFLVEALVSLQLRGGLANMLADARGLKARDLAGIHDELTATSVTHLLGQIDQELLRGSNWLDVGSGNGLITAKACEPAKVRSLTHIEPLITHYQNFLEDVRQAPGTIIRTFLPRRIEAVEPTDLTDASYSGIFLIHPYSDDAMINATFRLAHELRGETFHVVTIADSDDVASITRHASKYGFTGNWQPLDPAGNGNIFTPIL